MTEEIRSRVERILQNLLGESYELERSRSRVEDILIKLLDGSEEFDKPRSRVEALLTGLVSIIDSGGSLTDLDQIAFGNDPTVPEKGAITSSNLEDIAMAINDVASGFQSRLRLDTILISENGSYTPDPEHDGFNEVIVDVTPNLQSLDVTENGTYTPDEESDGFSEVTVEVDGGGSEPSLQSLHVTENGTYYPDYPDYDGFSEVIVEVDGGGSEPSLQFLTATENGTYYPAEDYDGFSAVSVEVESETIEPSLQSLEVTANGTYYPEEGYDGFSEVNVGIDYGYVDGFSVSGTLGNPFDNLSFSTVYSMLHVFWEVINVRPIMNLDATQLGLGTGTIMLFPQTNNGVDYILGTGGFVDQSSSMAITVIWDSTGLVSAYVEQDGTISNMSSYASMINTVTYGPNPGS